MFDFIATDFRFFAEEAGVQADGKSFLENAHQYKFEPSGEKDVYAQISIPSDGPPVGTKYKYRVDGSGSKFNLIRISYDLTGKRIEESFPARVVEIRDRSVRSGDSGRTIDTAIEIEGPKVCNGGTKHVRELLILPKADVVA